MDNVSAAQKARCVLLACSELPLVADIPASPTEGVGSLSGTLGEHVLTPSVINRVRVIYTRWR